MPCRGKKVSLTKQDSSLCVFEVCAISFFFGGGGDEVPRRLFCRSFSVLPLSEAFWLIESRRISEKTHSWEYFLEIVCSLFSFPQKSGHVSPLASPPNLVCREEWDFPLILSVLIVLYDSLVLGVRVSACVWALDQRWHCVLPTALILCSSGFVRIHPPTNTSFSHYRCHQRLKSRRLKSLTCLLTSLSTDLSARGRLRAGAGRQRKPRRSRTFFKRTWGGSGCGWKDALSLHLRGFFPPVTGFSHRNVLVPKLWRRLGTRTSVQRT